MNTKLIIGLLSSATIGMMVGCNNIERESKDVSTNAATLSADTLETLKLTELDVERATAVVADTTPTTVSDGPTVSNNRTAEGIDNNGYTETEVVQIDTISTRIVYDVRTKNH